MKVEKFNGKGNVIIRTNGEEEFNGVKYKAGDIISYIENVNVSISYDATIKDATSVKRELTNIEYYPDMVQIEDVPNTKEIRNLLYSEEQSHTSISFIKQEEEIAQGEILLNTQRSILEIKMFSNGEPIDFEYNADKKSVTLKETFTNVEIFIFTSQKSIDFRLKKPVYGYLNLLIVIDGKFGEKEGQFSVSIPKAMLVTDPSFSVSDDSYAATLVFSIVDSKLPGKSPVVSYIGEK